VGPGARGTTYVITGGAGAFTFDLLELVGVDPAILCRGTPGSRVCAGDHHYLTLEVQGNRLTV
jgi:hypothetical protein